jgi:L-2,4-diaminobutyrate decarboxylase
LSLKLWMMLATHGRSGLAELAERRVAMARRFAQLVDAHPRLRRLNDPDLAAVAFLYLPPSTPCAPTAVEVERVNVINQRIHERIIAEGVWHLHQFSLPDDLGRLRAGATLFALRFMANNRRTTEQHMVDVLDYVIQLGRDCEKGVR